VARAAPAPKTAAVKAGLEQGGMKQ
jgi:hypothetical protein